MGYSADYRCRKCGYHTAFRLGSGFMSFEQERELAAFNCPDCGNLAVKEVRIHNDGSEMKCERCGATMKRVDLNSTIVCPECRSTESTLGSGMLLWD